MIQVSWGQKRTCSAISSEKVIIFYRGHDEATDFFWRKKGPDTTDNRNTLAFFNPKRIHIFSEEIISCFLFWRYNDCSISEEKKYTCLIVSSKTNMFFDSEDIMRHLMFFWKSKDAGIIAEDRRPCPSLFLMEKNDAVIRSNDEALDFSLVAVSEQNL